jgi:hypothetical protein
LIIGIAVGVVVLIGIIVGVVIGLNSCSDTPAPNPSVTQPSDPVTPTPTPEPSTPDTPSPGSTGDGALSAEALDFWNGGWYGWWQWTNAAGNAAELDGGWWDCLAEVTLNSDNTGHIVIWDNDWGKDDGVCEVDFTLTPGSSGYGIMTSNSGWFINHNVYVSQAEWVIDSGNQQYPNLIKITGYYQDADDPSTHLDYTIILRPWGTVWDDVPESYLPGHYDWYAAQIASGASLPLTIG